MRRPYAVFAHGVEIWEAEPDSPRAKALVAADFVVTNSEHTANRVRTLHPRAHVVGSCPLALLDDGENPGGVPDEQLLSQVKPDSVLILGRLSATERYKGHDELLDAWRDIRRRAPRAQLVIAGAGEDLVRLRAKTARLQILDAVLFTGRVSEATKRMLLDRAALFAMPSKGEGFGLVYLEAMRAGLACIGSTHDAAGDVIAHDRSGLLVDRDAPGALATAVVECLVNADLRRRFGAEGRRRYQALFTFERFRSRLAGLLSSGLEMGSQASSATPIVSSAVRA